jgi:hypothetical protein
MSNGHFRYIPTISKAYIRHMCGIYYQGLCKGISPRNMAFNFIWYSISIFGSWSSHWPLVHIVHDSSAWSVECRIRAEIDNTELHSTRFLRLKQGMPWCLSRIECSLSLSPSLWFSSTIHFAGFEPDAGLTCFDNTCFAFPGRRPQTWWFVCTAATPGSEIRV